MSDITDDILDGLCDNCGMPMIACECKPSDCEPAELVKQRIAQEAKSLGPIGNVVPCAGAEGVEAKHQEKKDCCESCENDGVTQEFDCETCPCHSAQQEQNPQPAPTPKEMIENTVAHIKYGFDKMTTEELRSVITRLHDATVEACEKAVNSGFPQDGIHTRKLGILQALRSMRINQVTER